MSSSRNRPNARRNKPLNQLRIIGGQWRGRKIPFQPVDGLRPTTDRIRETLFNWLAPHIAGARCLDLFAGSGALGLEALSRSAEFSCFIDIDPSVTQQVASNLAMLGSDRAALYTMPAVKWLEQFDPEQDQAFDILFLDPPFGKNLLAQCLAIISQKSLLSDKALVYLETGHEEPPPPIPACWQLHREKTAGQVNYRLYSINTG